jgi:hypothetical protein
MTGKFGKRAATLLASGIVLASLLAGPALARRIAVDPSTPVLLPSYCSVGATTCAAHNFGGVFGNVFVYSDGVVSVGQPLPSTASVAGGVGTLGNAFIAPGFFDETGSLDAIRVNAISFNQGLGEGYFDAHGHPVVGELRLEWVFGPAADMSVFELDLIDETLPLGQNPGLNPSATDDVSAFFGYGAAGSSWFPDTPPFLPPGAVIAWNIGGKIFSQTITAADNGDGNDLDNSQLEIDGLHFSPTAGVPEPAMWAMMISGLAFTGAVLRRRRRTNPQPV